MAKVSTSAAVSKNTIGAAHVHKAKVELQKAMKNLAATLSLPEVVDSEHYKAGKMIAETSRQNLNRLTRKPDQMSLSAANHMMRTVVKFTDELQKTYIGSENPSDPDSSIA
jgi:hypothetical protein